MGARWYQNLRFIVISRYTCKLTSQTPRILKATYVTMTAVLNKYYSKEFIQLVKQVKITSLTYCQPSKLGRMGEKKKNTCLPSTKAATYPSSTKEKNNLHEQVAIKVCSLTWATILTSLVMGSSPYCPHTHSCSIHTLLISLPSTGFT